MAKVREKQTHGSYGATQQEKNVILHSAFWQRLGMADIARRIGTVLCYASAGPRACTVGRIPPYRHCLRLSVCLSPTQGCHNVITDYYAQEILLSKSHK